MLSETGSVAGLQDWSWMSRMGMVVMIGRDGAHSALVHCIVDQENVARTNYHIAAESVGLNQGTVVGLTVVVLQAYLLLVQVVVAAVAVAADRFGGGQQ